MKNKKTALLIISLLFIISLPTTISAQAKYYKGYVILLTGDTLKGEIKKNPKKEYDNYTKIAYRKSDGNDIRTLSPKKVKGYFVDSSTFVSRTVESELVFVKLLSSGTAEENIYESQVQYEQMNETKVVSDYYIEKVNKDFVKVKSKKDNKAIEEAKLKRKTIEVSELPSNIKEK